MAIEMYNHCVLCNPEVNWLEVEFRSENDEPINNLIALAVCADFTQPQHQKDAKAENADVYLVSALISKGGFSEDEKILSNIATQLHIPVLLANFIGETGGWDAAGKSGAWDRKGNSVIQASAEHSGLTYIVIRSGQVMDKEKENDAPLD
jgi:predicted amidohydrolase